VNGDTQAIGRYWGVWHRDGFPITWKSLHLPFAAWAMWRRTVRRLHRRQRVANLRGRAHSATVYVSATVIDQLAKWLAPIHTPLYEKFGSVQNVMKLVGFPGSVNA
jgi:hypothetical protein